METRFNVRVSKGPRDWLVTVDCQDGSEYAKTLASTLDVALRMAVPYMTYAAEPDQVTQLLEQRAEFRDAARFGKPA